MPTIHPIGLVKDVTGTATHIARGALGLGLKAVGTVGEQVFRRVPGVDRHVTPTPTDVPPEHDTPQPVNVVQELDLDPAPVEDVSPATDVPPPITEIDAQADPDSVDVTPADVAEQLERGHDRSS